MRIKYQKHGNESLLYLVITTKLKDTGSHTEARCCPVGQQ